MLSYEIKEQYLLSFGADEAVLSSKKAERNISGYFFI
jgi:hypothetical protein